MIETNVATQERKQTLPCLCVDLDGTLVQTDTLVESLLAYLRLGPWRILKVIGWLFLGKARFKQRLGREVKLQPESLPYTSSLLDYLQAESQKGRKLLLATAADSSIAIPVAEHLGIFAGVIASEGRENISGERKLAAIRKVLGNEEFIYAGNSSIDLPVWKGAKGAIIAGAPHRLCRIVERSGVAIEHVFAAKKSGIRALLKAMRPYQWTKNVLVLAPIVLGHHVHDRGILLAGIRAFLAFSFCASAIYLINDMSDLQTDRGHLRKRHRPLAAGHLSIPAAGFAVIGLAVAAELLNPLGNAALFLAIYGVTGIAYSVYLKRLLIVDVISLAGFYTLRLLYGGAATGITVSVWMLAFSMFLFLSLALIKRITELRARTSEEGLTASGRGYYLDDLPQLTAICAASGLVSALVVVLYVRSPEVVGLYSRPQVLLGLFPLLVYWQSRLLILANRGRIDRDPIMFSLSDRASLAVAAALLLLIAVAA